MIPFALPPHILHIDTTPRTGRRIDSVLNYMGSGSDNTDWDFGPVICLLHSLSPGTTSASGQYVSPIRLADQAGVDSPRLGDFDRLWEFLGQPKDRPPPEVGFPASGQDPCLTDGPQALKGVRWWDEVEGVELEETIRGNIAPDLALLRTKRRRGSQMTKKAIERETLLQGNFNGSACSVATGHHPGSDLELQTLREYPEVGPGIGLYNACGHSFDESLDHSPLGKKARLITKLYQRFEADRGFLISLATPSLSILPTGIHVFVDFSNILIGFCDCVKKSRGLSASSRARRPRFSFHSLSLILERGRPAAKKVLVGSKPLLPEVIEAEQCGYETNILDKVLKVPTPRKMRRRGNGYGSGYGTSGQSSGSETNACLPERRMEQAVDEILHLKIMESLLDWNEPATIVLATGDAAEAEYSGGFMKMVERALERGWRVELVSFRDSISNAYKKKSFKDRWREQFEVTELNDFGDELLISS